MFVEIEKISKGNDIGDVESKIQVILNPLKNYKMRYFLILLALIYTNLNAQILPKNAKTYLALGDSYTIGESVPESERFPVQLVNQLNKKGYQIDSPTIIAKTGWTTDELQAGIEKANIEGKKYDFVTLLIGVNNQYRGRDVEVYRKEFLELLDKAIQFAGNHKRVVVVSIPDWGVTPFGKKSDKKDVSKKIDQFNAVQRQEVLNRGMTFIDITPISRVAETDLSLVAEDGLHPSGKMYGQWVEKILASL
jgi:lysophospholipase L1-like esterase